MKLGSFVKEDAICSTRNCCNSGESNLGLEEVLGSVLGLGFAARSREMTGAAEEPGGAGVMLRERAAPEVASM